MSDRRRYKIPKLPVPNTEKHEAVERWKKERFNRLKELDSFEAMICNFLDDFAKDSMENVAYGAIATDPRPYMQLLKEMFERKYKWGKS